MPRLLSLLVAAAALASLAACGKAGRPVAPPDTQYPHVYPNPALGPTAAKQKDGKALPPEWDQQDLKERFSPDGNYIDPAVRATTLNTLGRVLPGANLPNTTTVQGGDPMTQGLGAPSSSPLPPVQPPAVPGEEEPPQ